MYCIDIDSFNFREMRHQVSINVLNVTFKQISDSDSDHNNPKGKEEAGDRKKGAELLTSL